MYITINTLPAAMTGQLQQVIDRYLNVNFPALAIAIIHKGEWALNATWGWVDPEDHHFPVTPNTIFDLASVTKLFTTMAFLSLVSAGKIALDDALVTVVPEFGRGGSRSIDGGQDPHTKIQLPTPDAVRGQTVDPSKVTFRHLLTHTSGLAPWRSVFEEAGPPPSAPDTPDSVKRDTRWQNALRAICTYPFVGQPDGLVRYSDLGLMLLGEAVSRLHGTPGKLDAAVQALILDPLDLRSMVYNPVQNGRDRQVIVPTEYDGSWRKRRCWGEVHDENACGVGGVAGHAGLFGTAADVARFGQACLEINPKLGISRELMSQARQEQAETDGMRRGLGWQIKALEDSSAGDLFSADSFGHMGFTGTSLWIDPQRELVAACFTNRVYMGREKPGIHAFRRAVHDVFAAGVDGR